MAWRAAPFEAVHGGAPRDYINDYKMGVDATLEPLKYILEANAQSNQQQQNNATNLNAAVGEQNRSTLAQATLALDRAKQAHYEQSDTARLALDQARENRLKTQDAAEQMLTPYKVALVQSQIANFKFDQDTKTTALNNQAEDALNLGNFMKQIHGLSTDDILAGKANDIFSEYGSKLHNQESIKRLQDIMHERTDTGTTAAMTKEQGNWNADEWATFKNAGTPKEQGGQGMSQTQAFGLANGAYQQRTNKANVKENDEDYGVSSNRSGAQALYGINPKSLDQFSQPEDKEAVGHAESLAQAWRILHKQNPDQDAFYKANPAQALKDAGFNNVPAPGAKADAAKKPTVADSLLGPKPAATPTPSAPQLNPSANPEPSTDSSQPITTTGFPSAMLSPDQHDTLGDIQDWRASQLADIQNAQTPEA